MVSFLHSNQAQSDTKIGFAVLVVLALLPTILLAETVSYVSAKSGLWLRDTPSTTGKQIILIPYNDQVKIISLNPTTETIQNNSGHWVLVNYGSKQGWVFGGFLSENITWDYAGAYRAELEGSNGKIPTCAKNGFCRPVLVRTIQTQFRKPLDGCRAWTVYLHIWQKFMEVVCLDGLDAPTYGQIFLSTNDARIINTKPVEVVRKKYFSRPECVWAGEADGKLVFWDIKMSGEASWKERTSTTTVMDSRCDGEMSLPTSHFNVVRYYTFDPASKNITVTNLTQDCMNMNPKEPFAFPSPIRDDHIVCK